MELVCAHRRCSHLLGGLGSSGTSLRSDEIDHFRDLRPGHIQAALRKMRDGGRRSRRKASAGDESPPPSPLAPQTLVNRYTVIRKALGDAVRLRYLYENPALGVLPPSPGRADLFTLDPGDVAALLDCFPVGDSMQRTVRRVVRTVLGTGCRRGEVLALRWSDFDAERGTLRVERSVTWTKTGIVYGAPKSDRSQRTIALGAETVTVLREQRAEQLRDRMALGNPETFNAGDLIFADPIGEPVNPDVLTNRFRQAVADTPLAGLRLHDLRHAHAMLLILGGMDARTVSDRLGHARTSFMLDTYANPVSELERRAAESIDAILSGRKAARVAYGPDQ